MRRKVRFPILAAAVTAAVLSAAATAAGAQSVSQVSAGSEVTVANNGECRPDSDVALYFEGDGIDQVQVGSSVSDATGSFEATVPIPGEAAEGRAAILVDCGLDSAVLTYELEVLGSGFSLSSLVGPVLVGLAVIGIIGLVAVLRRRHANDAETPADAAEVETAGAIAMAPSPAIVADAADGVGESPMAPAHDLGAVPPVPPPPAIPPQPVTPTSDAGGGEADDVTAIDAPDEHDDGADYWFWEAATSAGPRRRVACMTETTFHLHEVSVDEFQPMLDRLVEVGPDAALAQAFVRIPVSAIDRVVREGSVVHIEGRSASGPRRQTIDLADGADGVVEMLARRLEVVDAFAAQGSVH